MFVTKTKLIVFCLFVLLLVSYAGQYPNDFDCPMRNLALEFSQYIQPWLTEQQLNEISDALNGSPEAQNCNVSLNNLQSIKNVANF